MKRPQLSVDLAQEATPPQVEALGLDMAAQRSDKSRGRFSPGAVMQKAIGMVSRTPSRASRQGFLQGRASVNPLQRAAHDISYRHSLELTEQEKQDVAGFKKKPSKRRSMKEKPLTQDEDVRYVRHNDGPVGEFESNKVVTSKYNVITFFPLFLFEMFSRAAYLYFLLQAGLAWWSVVSPFGGVGATAALVFVLLVAGVKSVWEDTKRHQEDNRMNTSITHRVNSDGSVTDIFWTEVKVGDFLVVKDDELFPADMVCIYSALPDKVCFIKTTNLDGETNLKIRKPLDVKGEKVDDIKSAMNLRFTLMAELPNKNLHKFRGKLVLQPKKSEQKVSANGIPATVHEHEEEGVRESPVTMSEMLLRGCMLKNSHYVVGMVVYTGKESRIQMNAARTPLKVGSFDRFLNLQISLVIAMQIGMAIFLAVASYIWIQKEGKKHYYLALTYNVQGIFPSPVAQICINFLTFWILLSYLVPISLFVTMEIVKFWQGFIFINFDPDMKDPKTGESARCRNSGINEDLGKVEYVFSDKTGTLTSNEMQLRMIAIKGVPYGTIDFRLEDHPKLRGFAALKRFDSRLEKAAEEVQKLGSWAKLLQAGGSRRSVMAHPSSFPGDTDENDYQTVSLRATGQTSGYTDGASSLGPHLVDFWTNVCICQSLIIEAAPKEGSLPVYQGPSPDEVALVEAARQVGFEFKNRSMSSVTLNIFGEDVSFEVLNVMEYTSERGCMSVIARSPDGTIRIYCKGSDTKVMAKLRGRSLQNPPLLHQRTEENLSMFARQGLRTLVLATKIIPEDVYAEWDIRYQEAATSFEDRDGKMNRLGLEIEQDLELIGVTAIEDKLQDGVPMAINTLLEAGVKVWMITGDKQETAINIGVSCKLVSNPDTIMILNVDEKKEHSECEGEARQKLAELLEKTNTMLEPDAHGDVPPVGELAVDGPTLTFILADKTMTMQLAELTSRCTGVVVCRSSPSQKAAIVRMMMDYELRKAAGNSWGLWRWYKRHQRRLAGKMLSIGDGANDVAMIQTADVGVGIMGKEGRQAVNNSDYAISQFRFLVPLLLVHGNLSYYRLARLIKYSFYKNIAFAFVLFYYQFYNGFSGQALVDSITAAVYNVVFTSMPILLFSILDRPVKNLNAYIRYPQLYDKRHLGSLTTASFWKTGVLMAIIHGATCFFFSYYSIAPSNHNSVTDVYSLGKIAFVALLGSVTLEVALIARYWTWLFAIFTFFSYFLVFPFITLFPLLELAIAYYDPANVGVGEQVMRTPTFWFVIMVVYITNFGMRFAERTAGWVFRPHDTMILAEKERKDGLMSNMTAQSRKRLSELGLDAWRSRASSLTCLDPERAMANDDSNRKSGNGQNSPGRSSVGRASGSVGRASGSVGRTSGSVGRTSGSVGRPSGSVGGAAAARALGEDGSGTLRSHYSGSPAGSIHSSSPGASPARKSSVPKVQLPTPASEPSPNPHSKTSEISLRHHLPEGGWAALRQASGNTAGGSSSSTPTSTRRDAGGPPADSLEAWSQEQPPSATSVGSGASSKRVTFGPGGMPGLQGFSPRSKHK